MNLKSMVSYLYRIRSKSHTFLKWVVIKMNILCTPLTPRYYYLLLLVIIFSGELLLFSEESYKTLPEYKKLKLKDYILITGFLPEFSYDIFENNFSLQFSINGIFSNSFALYENQLNKEIFKNNFFKEISLKNESEKKQLLSEKKFIENESEKNLVDLLAIRQEISSLEGLIRHQKELVNICLEIYNYHHKEFKDGVITTINFLEYKKDYLSIVFKYEELIYRKDVLENEERSKRSQIPNSK